MNFIHCIVRFMILYVNAKINFLTFNFNFFFKQNKTIIKPKTKNNKMNSTCCQECGKQIQDVYKCSICNYRLCGSDIYDFYNTMCCIVCYDSLDAKSINASRINAKCKSDQICSTSIHNHQSSIVGN